MRPGSVLSSRRAAHDLWFYLPKRRMGLSISRQALSQSFEDVAFLWLSSQSTNLRHLSINPDKWPSPEKYLRVLEAASRCCPNLETLRMVGWVPRDVELVLPHRELATW